jgi:hypothetical protein
MIFPSSCMLLLLNDGLKRITNFGPVSKGELLVAPQGPARVGRARPYVPWSLALDLLALALRSAKLAPRPHV